MNLKIDFDSSLKDFEANCQAADAALDDKSNNIIPIIYSGLQLTSCLSFDFDIDLYCELHSTCLIYFANLRKALSDKSRFSKDKLNVAFEISLSCPYVLPRIYLALLIACTTKNKEQLKLISEMLLAVAHPLRSLLLRFTAISFFPKCPELADLLVDFAVTNFKEMLFLLSGFLKNYPKSKQLACQWLTSNTTISLFLSDNNPNIVKSFFDFAKACKENYVSIAIVDSISQSIEGPQIPKYFDLFADFFKTKAREEMKKNKIMQAKKLGGNAKPNTAQKSTPTQNQQKIIKPQPETPSPQNVPATNPNPNNAQANQPPKNPNSQQNRQQSPKSNPPSTQNQPPPPQHQSQQPQQPQQKQQQQPPQQQQPSKSQIQINRFQPAAVAMPPMGRVALPPMRPMTSVAMPPISLPQQQQQQQQTDNQQDQEQHQQNDESKKDEENQEAENENENSHDNPENMNDDESSDSSNAEEDENEESENEEQNQQNEIKQETEPKSIEQEQNQTENETKSANENEKDNGNEDTKQPNPPSIRLMQSFSDSSLVSEIKGATSITNPTNAPTNESNSQQNAPLQITSSLSSPSLSINQSQQQSQSQPKKQKQRRRQQHANTLYNATKHIAIACLEKCDNPREGFRFIQMTPFAESCGLEVTRLALRMNDIEVVKMCASRWMKPSVLHEILTKLGYKAFAEIVPQQLPSGLEITKEFIQKVAENPETDSSDSISLRKILSGELHGRSAELDGYINELIITHLNYDESFYRTLFAEPYRFNDFLQISSVVSRYTSSFIPSASDPNEKEAMKKTVLGFLERTIIDIQNIISLRCSVYENDENGDDLVTKSLESIQDSILNCIEYNCTPTNNINLNNEMSFDSNLSLVNDKTTSSSLAAFPTKDQIEEKASVARRILISHLSRLQISDSSLENLFNQLANFVQGKGFMPKSTENNEFIGFILLSAIKGNQVLTEKALLMMLDMDLNTTKVSDQIHLYFEALNIILSVTENEKENSCLISLDTTKRILEQIVDIINALESFKKFFPIMTPEQSNYLLKIADQAKKKKHFAQFESIFDSIIESLKNC